MEPFFLALPVIHLRPKHFEQKMRTKSTTERVQLNCIWVKTLMLISEARTYATLTGRNSVVDQVSNFGKTKRDKDSLKEYKIEWVKTNNLVLSMFDDCIGHSADVW